MYKHTTTTTPKLQGVLRQNFEAALVELHEGDPKGAVRRTPIVQRQQPIRRTEDPRTQAITVAASALATLWGL